MWISGLSTGPHHDALWISAIHVTSMGIRSVVGWSVADLWLIVSSQCDSCCQLNVWSCLRSSSGQAFDDVSEVTRRLAIKCAALSFPRCVQVQGPVRPLGSCCLLFACVTHDLVQCYTSQERYLLLLPSSNQDQAGQPCSAGLALVSTAVLAAPVPQALDISLLSNKWVQMIWLLCMCVWCWQA